ncbi:MAG: hypothetical protein WEC12_06260 [Balneolaceae bacterium]
MMTSTLKNKIKRNTGRSGSFLFRVLLLAGFLSANLQASPAQSKWDQWEYRIPVVLTERDSETAGALPVDVTFAVFADEIDDPHRELRLVRKTDGELQEVPFQLWNVSTRNKDTDGERSMPTLTGTVTFFDEAGGGNDSEYLLLYGNPEAEPPSYPTDLSVSGEAPELVIENGRMTVTLHSSGQLASVRSSGSEQLIDSPPGVMHWNPGIFIPTRYWTHSWDWDPAEVVEVESGPVFVKLRRSGPLPGFPEMRLSITYRIFADRPYVESATRMELNEDLGVVALRNDQLVFNSGLFSSFAWQQHDGGVVTRHFDEHEPVNDHGDLLRIRPDAGFIAFFDEDQGIGAATVRLDAMNEGPDATPPVLFDHATYITDSTDLTYWFRPLVYFHVDWTREKLISVPEGSVYSERNLYLFFTPEDGNPVAPVRHYRRAADNPPLINLGVYELPPVY